MKSLNHGTTTENFNDTQLGLCRATFSWMTQMTGILFKSNIKTITIHHLDQHITTATSSIWTNFKNSVDYQNITLHWELFTPLRNNNINNQHQHVNSKHRKVTYPSALFPPKRQSYPCVYVQLWDLAASESWSTQTCHYQDHPSPTNQTFLTKSCWKTVM